MNSVALITGASRGIGRGIALELAQIGHDLVINYATNLSAAKRTAADCLSLGKKAGKKILAEICQADIAKGRDRQKLIDFTKAKFGRLDLLVNNAGVAPDVRADILDASEGSFDRMININVKGPYFLTQLAAQWMIEQTEARRTSKSERGRLVPASSTRSRGREGAHPRTAPERRLQAAAVVQTVLLPPEGGVPIRRQPEIRGQCADAPDEKSPLLCLNPLWMRFASNPKSSPSPPSAPMPLR